MAVRRRTRVLAGVLALRANSALPPSWIVDALWGESPPASAAVNLRSHVAELRRGLPREWLESGPAGYRLAVQPAELDALAFTELVEQGQRGLASDDHELAVERLTRATGLWRGPVLDGLPVPDAVQPLVQRLQGHHLDAIEDCHQARLALGQHLLVAAELRELVERYPLRERLWGQLMLALHRCGHQAEAAATYRRLCRLLEEELGVEPGQPLQRLHQRIVRSDPSLHPTPRTVAVPAPAPRQLPPDITSFVGRTSQLDELDLAAAGSDTAVVISSVSGTAGVGKTALAVHWAHRVRDRFPDGSLYVDLRGYGPDEPLEPAAALGGFLRALGMAAAEQPGELAELTAAYRTRLAGRRVLVVLDNARCVEQVRPLLPGTAPCLVVVTSRDGLPGLVARDGARRIELDLLPPGEAVALLRGLVGHRVAAEPAAAAALAQACARLPLALRLAAELANRRPGDTLATLVDGLTDQRRRLDLLAAGGDQQTAVRAVFDWSYLALDSDAARMFRLLSLHPGPDLDDWAAAALADTGLDDARRTIDRLSQVHLVRPSGEGRYRVHDLLRAYGAERAAADPVEQRRAALERLFGYYLRATAAAETHFPLGRANQEPGPLPGPVPPLADLAQATRWLDAERATLVALAAYGARNDWPAQVCQLSRSLRPYLDGCSHYREAVVIHQHAAACARQLADREAEGAALHCLGSTCGRLGRFQEAAALLQQALTVREQAGDQPGLASTRNNLAIVYQALGLHQEAVRCHQQALLACRESGDQTTEGMVLGNLALAHFRLGHYPDAANCHQQALEIFRRRGNRAFEGVELGNLGTLHARQGRHRDAVDHGLAALAISIEMGDRSGQGCACGNLGFAYTGLGELSTAQAYLERSLALHREVGDQSSEAVVLVYQGELLRRLGRYQEALHTCRQALTLGGTLDGDQLQQAQALIGIAAALLALGQYRAAATHYESALGLSRAGDHPYEQARALDGLGHAHQLAGEAATAAEHWRQALAGYTALGVAEADQLRSRLATRGVAALS